MERRRGIGEKSEIYVGPDKRIYYKDKRKLKKSPNDTTFRCKELIYESCPATYIEDVHGNVTPGAKPHILKSRPGAICQEDSIHTESMRCQILELKNSGTKVTDGVYSSLISQWVYITFSNHFCLVLLCVYLFFFFTFNHLLV